MLCFAHFSCCALLTSRAVRAMISCLSFHYYIRLRSYFTVHSFIFDSSTMMYSFIIAHLPLAFAKLVYPDYVRFCVISSDPGSPVSATAYLEFSKRVSITALLEWMPSSTTFQVRGGTRALAFNALTTDSLRTVLDMYGNFKRTRKSGKRVFKSGGHRVTRSEPDKRLWLPSKDNGGNP